MDAFARIIDVATGVARRSDKHHPRPGYRGHGLLEDRLLIGDQPVDRRLGQTRSSVRPREDAIAVTVVDGDNVDTLVPEPDTVVQTPCHIAQFRKPSVVEHPERENLNTGSNAGDPNPHRLAGGLVVSHGSDDPSYPRAVGVSIARVVVIVDEVPAPYVVNIVVGVIVDAVCRLHPGLVLVAPDVVAKIGVVEVDPSIDDGDHCRAVAAAPC